MSNLLFFRRSDAYRHAGLLELRNARALPAGLERIEARKRARALKDLARSEAWLEGQNPRRQPLRLFDASGFAEPSRRLLAASSGFANSSRES